MVISGDVPVVALPSFVVLSHEPLALPSVIEPVLHAVATLIPGLG
jgi:hypothetical protein